MKTKLFILAAAAVLSSACTNLHEEILNEENGQALVQDTANIDKVIAPAYINVREIFFKNFELVTDEACLPARGTDWKSVNTQPLTLHDFSVTNTNIRYIWRNTTAGISACNTALLTLSGISQTLLLPQGIHRSVRSKIRQSLSGCRVCGFRFIKSSVGIR